MYNITTANEKKAVEAFFSTTNIFCTLTYVCNAFCKKCSTRYHRFKNQYISYEQLNNILNLLTTYNYKGTVNLGGGESLTFSNLDYFVKTLLNKNSELKIRILTNGLLLNEKLPDYFFDKRIQWGITLDGFYNKDLSNLQSGIDLEIIKNNIEKLCKKGFADRFYLNYTLNNQNFSSLKNYIDFANTNGVKELYLTEMKIYYGFEELDKYRFDDNKEEELRILENYAKSLNFSYVRFSLTKSAKEFHKCYNHNHIYPLVDIDGTISFCYGREGSTLGNINNLETIVKWFNLSESLSKKDLAAQKWCSKCSTKYDNKDYKYLPKNIFTNLGNNGKDEKKS